VDPSDPMGSRLVSPSAQKKSPALVQGASASRRARVDAAVDDRPRVALGGSCKFSASRADILQARHSFLIDGMAITTPVSPSRAEVVNQSLNFSDGNRIRTEFRRVE
jgi:hypothetical protein